MQSDGEYILMSGSAKLLAIGLTYPYQVVRSRMQVCLFSCSRLEANDHLRMKWP
jgi:hypothetical protein